MRQFRTLGSVGAPEKQFPGRPGGQESTVEKPMKKVDESPRPDDDTDLQTRFFQLQMENDQLQAKVEQYKTLLDRAMRLIERMKNEQRVCV